MSVSYTHLNKVALFFKISYDCFSRLIAVHTVILAAVYDLSVLIQNEDLLKVVSESCLIVVRVVAWSQLNGACTEAKLNEIIGNDW